MTFFVTHVDGRPATAAELAPLAFAGYAHFTAAQVRDGRVRGLDLQLARLRSASGTLFGRALPDALVRDRLRAALADSPPDVSLTATVFSPDGEFRAGGADAGLSLLVRTGAPHDGPAGPLALALIAHERDLPAVKHVGEVAKTLLLRRAVADGFDDAAFVDRRGRLSEATIWNLAFWDGESVLWPRAELLTGTTLGVVTRQLERLGVPQDTREITAARLPDLAGAVVLNSWTPAVPVHRIDTVALPDSATLAELLHRAWRAEEPVAP